MQWVNHGVIHIFGSNFELKTGISESEIQILHDGPSDSTPILAPSKCHNQTSAHKGFGLRESLTSELQIELQLKSVGPT